jgi:hypothetical protein
VACLLALSSALAIQDAIKQLADEAGNGKKGVNWARCGGCRGMASSTVLGIKLTKAEYCLWYGVKHCVQELNLRQNMAVGQGTGDKEEEECREQRQPMCAALPQING